MMIFSLLILKKKLQLPTTSVFYYKKYQILLIHQTDFDLCLNKSVQK